MLPDIELYLKRYAAGNRILPPPADIPQLIVTIPAHREENLVETLQSLRKCAVPCRTEVIVLLNHSDQASQEIKLFHYDYLESLKKTDWNIEFLTFHFLCLDLPEKHAGVGLARKIVMDEAVRRTGSEGIILALDADCTVDRNYLEAVVAHFARHPRHAGASVYFEHPLPSDKITREAIISYELHLRYYVELQRYLGLPYAFHTVGSSMAVRPSAYCRAGGMNRRKAGEDFYFLQRVIPQGYGEINSTTVYPAARRSDRVPFGTGRAVSDLCEQIKQAETYSPENVLLIKYLLELIFSNNLIISNLNINLKKLSKEIDLEENMERIMRQSVRPETFRRNFFHWFDGFMLMKCLHYLRRINAPDIPVDHASGWLLKIIHGFKSPGNDKGKLLDIYRSIQRSN